MPNDPQQSTTPPQWRLSNFSTTVPFRLEGRLEYTSWTELDNLLTAELRIADMPQLTLEFGQNVSRLQAGVGLQLLERQLPQLGPYAVQIGVDAMARWADGAELELSSELEMHNVRWPNLSFFLEGSIGLSGGDSGPEVNGTLMTGVRWNFDIFSPPNTWRRRR